MAVIIKEANPLEINARDMELGQVGIITKSYYNEHNGKIVTRNSKEILSIFGCPDYWDTCHLLTDEMKVRILLPGTQIEI